MSQQPDHLRVDRFVTSSAELGRSDSGHVRIEYRVPSDYWKNSRDRFVLAVSERVSGDGPDDGSLCPVLQHVLVGDVVYVPTPDRWQARMTGTQSRYHINNVQGRTTENHRHLVQIIENMHRTKQEKSATISEQESTDRHGNRSQPKAIKQVSVNAVVWPVIKADLQRLIGVDLRDLSAVHAALQAVCWPVAPIVPLQQSLLQPRQ